MTIHEELVSAWDTLARLLHEGKTCNVDTGSNYVENQEKFIEDLRQWYKGPIIVSIPNSGPGQYRDGSYRGILQVASEIPSNKDAKILLKKR